MSTMLHEQLGQADPSLPTLPPLDNGDRLTRAEFYKRWDAMPRLKNAERIERVVHLKPKVRADHGHSHAHFVGWLTTYKAHTRGTQTATGATVQLDLDNDAQPDVFLRILPEFGGQSITTTDGYVGGAPELVAEVAASSASYDLHKKLHVYRRNGVREYVVWKVLEQEVVWFQLQDDKFQEVKPDDRGLFKSDQFPGLWLNCASLIEGKLAEVLMTLQQGIDTPEHQEFINQLKQSHPET